MGPKTAKAAEKVVPRDEGQVVYVKINVAVPPPPVVAPPTAAATPSPAPTATAAAPAAPSPSKSGTKASSKTPEAAVAPVPATPVPAPAATPAAPVIEEIHEMAFEIVVNVLCRTDIAIDYIRRQFIKVIQEKLAAPEDPLRKLSDGLKLKLKEIQTTLTNQSNQELILRDTAGVDIFFKEVRYDWNRIK